MPSFSTYYLYTLRLLELEGDVEQEEVAEHIWPAGILQPSDIPIEEADRINVELDAQDDKDDALMEVALQTSLDAHQPTPTPAPLETQLVVRLLWEAWLKEATSAHLILVDRLVCNLRRHA